MNLPWRFDLENMPKDGTRFLVHANFGFGQMPMMGRFVEYSRPEGKTMILCTDQGYALKDADAWLPVSPPITLEEGRKNAEAS